MDDQIIGHFANGSPIYRDGDRGLATIFAHPANSYHLTDHLVDSSLVEDGGHVERLIGDLRVRHFASWTVAMHLDAADAHGQWLQEGPEKDYPSEEADATQAARAFHQVAAHLMLGGAVVKRGQNPKSVDRALVAVLSTEQDLLCAYEAALELIPEGTPLHQAVRGRFLAALRASEGTQHDIFSAPGGISPIEVATELVRNQQDQIEDNAGPGPSIKSY